MTMSRKGAVRKMDIRSCGSYRTNPYPGEIPAGPFHIRAGTVHEIDGSQLERLAQLEHLGESDEWLPILSYGSNACPGRLAGKFGRPDGILVLPAKANGVERSWVCNVNSQNVVPQTLVHVDHVIDCHVILLPHRYLRKMDRSEGRGGKFYSAVHLNDVEVIFQSSFVWRRPIAYLGHGERGPLVVGSAPALVQDFSESDARAFIESGRAVGDDSWLPPHTVIDPSISLSDVETASAEQILAAF